MPASRPVRVSTRDQVVGHEASTPDSIERAIAELGRLMPQIASRSQFVADLVIGDNRVNHNLGRLPKHVTLMPTVADATFAWAVTSMTERQLVIEVAGAAQPGASIEVS